MPTIATTVAVMAAKGLIACGAEAQVAMNTSKIMIVTNPTPVPKTNPLWLMFLTSHPLVYVYS
jgi:hypothetical protein